MGLPRLGSFFQAVPCTDGFAVHHRRRRGPFNLLTLIAVERRKIAHSGELFRCVSRKNVVLGHGGSFLVHAVDQGAIDDGKEDAPDEQ